MRHRALVLCAAALAAVAAATSGCVALVTIAATALVVPSAPGASGLAAIPPPMLSLYVGAAATCPGLPWTVLAAIGTVESANGSSDAAGVHSGANAAGAEGPMQFEPATFASVAVVGPGGAVPPSPYDPSDAVYSAARLLCRDGAGSPATLPRAIFDYNHSSRYVADVLRLAAGDAQAAVTGATPARAGRR